VPKGKTQLEDTTAAKRRDDVKLAAMRKDVWRRDGGVCQQCGRKVIRTLALVPNRGEVHHRRGRNVAPESRYDAGQCLLLCAECHDKVTRKLVKL
jgi:5-methylcytosine-specific restriction endonuclease McrA